MARVDYSRGMEVDDIRAVCTNCDTEKCPGICDRYKAAYRDTFGDEKPKAKRQKCQRYNQSYECDGLAMTLQEWANACGIKYTTLYSRMHESNLTLKEALTRPIHNPNRGKLYTVGSRAMTVQEWAAEIGLTPRRVYILLRNGLTMPEIVSGKREIGGSYYYRIGRFKRV